MSNKTIVVFMALLIALLSVGIASADTLAGRGWIRAKGDGTAVLSGNVATATITGTGNLWFKDDGDPDRPDVRGYKDIIRYPNGWVEYVGFHGVFHLDRADQVTVKITGRDINLFAAGMGRVYLRGQGQYVYGTQEHEIGRGDWDNRNLTVGFGE